MIVEMFGPPAVGKTTFARALAVQLRAGGLPVTLVVSDRPADRAKEGATCGAPGALQRVVRPVVALAATTREMLARSPDAQTISQVLAMVSPAGMLRSVRFRQYLLRLLLSWREAAQRKDIITLFDQGCAQAVCSLATHMRERDLERLRRLLLLLPAGDLLIRVDAPRARVRAKLRARLERQGPLERCMERSLEEGLAFIPIAAEIDAVCHALGRQVIMVDTADEQARGDAVLRIAVAIATMGHLP
ncbi:MAG: hypothetical protein ACRET2_01950, partial [Steroidobacteraceae bacterium]